MQTTVAMLERWFKSFFQCYNELLKIFNAITATSLVIIIIWVWYGFCRLWSLLFRNVLLSILSSTVLSYVWKDILDESISNCSKRSI